MPCAVILTAIPVEYKAVKAHLTDLREKTHPEGTVYEIGKFKIGKFFWDDRSWQVAIAEIGAGHVGAAVETKRAVDYFKPDVLLFVGVAGGIKDVKLGDVVAATKVYGYESGKDVEGAFFPRPNVDLVTFRLEQRAKAEARKDDWLERIKASVSQPSPQAYVGAIAAGDKVVASTKSEVYQLLRNSYSDALAVEMESDGILKAVRANPEINTLIIRGISDLIDKKGEADAAGNQEIAARHASAFAFQVLAELEKAERINLFTASLTSIAVAALVIFSRSLGLLQPVELLAYDLLMSWRPTEKLDDRVVIVEIANNDLEGTEISNEKLLKLLTVLKNYYEPQTIGLDVYVDNPQKQGNDKLVNYLAAENSDDVIASCLVIPKYLQRQNPVKYNPKLYPGAISPRTSDGTIKIPDDRLGFTNFQSEDFLGFNLIPVFRFIRRYQLTIDDSGNADNLSSTCNTWHSLGLAVSLDYLITKKKIIKYEFNSEDYLELTQTSQKKTILKELKDYAGGYRWRNIDGYQVLLNYRSRPPQKSFHSFKTTDIINQNQEIDPLYLKDKIVLIGYTADISGQYNDLHYTPYSFGKWPPGQRMAGVVIHAHLVSQILSSVLDDNRVQLWVLPFWIDQLGIVVCSLGGGVFLGWVFQFNQRKLGVVVGIVSLLLVKICFIFLEQQGLWLPLIPYFMVVVIAAWAVGMKIFIVTQLQKRLIGLFK